jgi:hypothetical protein
MVQPVASHLMNYSILCVRLCMYVYMRLREVA